MNILRFSVCLIFVLITKINAQGDNDVRCFSCGYMIQVDGSKTPIDDNTKLCGDFAEQSDAITNAGPVSVRKYYLLNSTERMIKNNTAMKLFLSIKHIFFE